MAAQAKGSGRSKGSGRPKGRPGPAKPQSRSTPSPQPGAPAKPKNAQARHPRAKTSTSGAPAPATSPAPETGITDPAPARPVGLRLAAAAELVEAVGLCVAAVFAGVLTADGKSHQVGAGIGLTVLAVGTAIGLAAIAVGLARARPWSRTPAGMTQLFAVIAGIVLLDGHRPEWGVPALVLAAACMAGLLTPASLRALNRAVKTQ